jgi:3-carboxy-cis,cis-muconate cycloisomerase
MRANIELTHGAVVAERLAVALTPALGKAQAKALLAKASTTPGSTFGEVLRTLPELAGLDLDDLLDPARYVGAAGPLVDRVLLRYRSYTGL